MHVASEHITQVTRFIRVLRGGSQPILVEASNGLLYVAKFLNNLQGPNVLFNEKIGNELYRACGLLVPSTTELLVTDSFLDQNRSCWFQTPKGLVRPNSGLCLGSRYLGTDGARLLEILPGNFHQRVRNRLSFWLAWLIDVCAEHTDNRQALFMKGTDGGLNAFFIDHGHLFGGADGRHSRGFLASRYLDKRIYPVVSSNELIAIRNVVQSLDADKLWKQVHRLPEDWKSTSAIEGFQDCLDRFSKTDFLRDLLSAMANNHMHGIVNLADDLNYGQEIHPEILCDRVQNRRSAPRAFSGQACSFNCG
jgi:hypothetical protein